MRVGSAVRRHAADGPLQVPCGLDLLIDKPDIFHQRAPFKESSRNLTGKRIIGGAAASRSRRSHLKSSSSYARHAWRSLRNASVPRVTVHSMLRRVTLVEQQRAALRPLEEAFLVAISSARRERSGSSRDGTRSGRQPDRTHERAPKRPLKFYRLSAVCQPTVEKLVAGARNRRYLQLWSGAA